MNSKTLLAVAAFAAIASASARADDITVDNTKFVSSKTRAEVLADLAQYRKAGVNLWASSYNPLNTFKSSLTREEVRADYIANRDKVAALTGEGIESVNVSRVANVPTRLHTSTTLGGSPANTQ